MENSKEIKRMFDADSREKKNIAHNASHRVRNRSTGCTLPRYTAKELAMKNGECRTINLNLPMRWPEFTSLEGNLPRVYLQEIVKKYNPSIKDLVNMFKCNRADLNTYLTDTDLLYIMEDVDPTKHDELAWLRFLASDYLRFDNNLSDEDAHDPVAYWRKAAAEKQGMPITTFSSTMNESGVHANYTLKTQVEKLVVFRYLSGNMLEDKEHYLTRIKTLHDTLVSKYTTREAICKKYTINLEVLRKCVKGEGNSALYRIIYIYLSLIDYMQECGQQVPEDLKPITKKTKKAPKPVTESKPTKPVEQPKPTEPEVKEEVKEVVLPSTLAGITTFQFEGTVKELKAILDLMQDDSMISATIERS